MYINGISRPDKNDNLKLSHTQVKGSSIKATKLIFVFRCVQCMYFFLSCVSIVDIRSLRFSIEHIRHAQPNDYATSCTIWHTYDIYLLSNIVRG